MFDDDVVEVGVGKYNLRIPTRGLSNFSADSAYSDNWGGIEQANYDVNQGLYRGDEVYKTGGQKKQLNTLLYE